jgi:hypothetical protein
MKKPQGSERKILAFIFGEVGLHGKHEGGKKALAGYGGYFLYNCRTHISFYPAIGKN